MKSYIVIGLGRFGQTLARQLCSLGAEVLALELSPTDAVWHIRYEGPGEENREVYALEDYVTQNAKLELALE